MHGMGAQSVRGMTAQYLTIAQCADVLNVEHKTIRKAIRLGKLEAVRIFHQWRISPDAFSSFIESNTPIVQIKRRRAS